MNPKAKFDESYVREILRDVSSRVRNEFYRQCERDTSGGYQAEVDEAWARRSKEIAR
jgi:hypothetical protein